MLGGKQIQDETLGRREGQKGRKSGVLREGRTNPHFREIVKHIILHLATFLTQPYTKIALPLMVYTSPPPL